VRANNYQPTAHIVAPRTGDQLVELKEATTNAYMIPPTTMLPILPTKQVPITLTTGTSTDTSEVYTAQWNQLAVGMRTGFELRDADRKVRRQPAGGVLGASARRRAGATTHRIRRRHRREELGMAGFEMLRDVLAFNAKFHWDSFYEAIDEPCREGIPLELRRALPDSPGAS
jgi:hypothetical protein